MWKVDIKFYAKFRKIKIFPHHKFKIDIFPRLNLPQSFISKNISNSSYKSKNILSLIPMSFQISKPLKKFLSRKITKFK